MNASELKSDQQRLPLSRLTGRIFLGIGFLIAAFVSVINLEQANKWQTIPWTVYIPALAVGFAGIAISKKTPAGNGATGDGNSSLAYEMVSNQVVELLKLLGEAKKERHRLPQDTLQWIEGNCTERFAAFANSRQAIMQRFDLKIYADVMTEFASAERSINRAWSAAADGYIDEINLCIDRSYDHLGQVRDFLEQAEKAES